MVDAQASGWDAIIRALGPLYAGQEPRHYGTLISYELGGRDPLRGISAYKRLHPVPHWHLITFGFTELFEKQSPNQEVSGWGFELTMRLTADAAAEQPPVWVLVFLQNLARYVFQTGNAFSNWDYLNANGPIASDTDTVIRSVAFTHDPELPPIETPNGRVEFLQVVGITDDEELAIRRWEARKVIEVFGEHLPLLVTDLDRASLLEAPEVQEKLSAGAAAEGSNSAYVFVDQLSWEVKKRLLRAPEIHVVLGARQVKDILDLLAHRLPFGREFGLVGGELKLVFFPSGENRHSVEGDTLRLDVRPDVLVELQSVLEPREGAYHLRTFKDLVVEVRKTHITDDMGNVARTIG